MADRAATAGWLMQQAGALAQRRGMTPQDAYQLGRLLSYVGEMESFLDPASVAHGGAGQGLFHFTTTGAHTTYLRQMFGNAADRLNPAQQLAVMDQKGYLDKGWQAYKQTLARGGSEEDAFAAFHQQFTQPAASEIATSRRSGRSAEARGLVDQALTQVGQGAGGVAENVSANVTPAGGARSPYVFPVQGYQGAVNTHWGEVRGGSDIFAPKGTPVLAMRGGVVESVGSGGLGGNNLTIRGDDGLVYYYAHGDRPAAVKQGQQVAAGTYLFGVGSTGNAEGTGDHLHIGIGRDIVRGGGKTGGTGGDFDAVTLLQGAQRGTASAPGRSNTVPVDPTLQTVVDNASADLEKSRDRIATLQQQLANVKDDPNRPGGAVLERNSLLEAIDSEQKNYNTLLSRYVSAQDLIRKSSASTAMTPAEQFGAGMRVAEFNRTASQDAITNAQNAEAMALKYADLISGDNRFIANYIKDAIINSNQNARSYYETAVKRGEVGIDAAQNAINTHLALNNQALSRMGILATTAKFVSDTNFRNAQALLPADQEYVPMFGPNDPLSRALGRIGLGSVAVRLQRVDPKLLEPSYALGEAERLTPQIEKPDMTAYNQAVKDFQAIPLPQYQNIDTTSVGAPGGLLSPIDYAGIGAAARAGAPQAAGMDPALAAFLDDLLYGQPGAGDGQALPPGGAPNAQPPYPQMSDEPPGRAASGPAMTQAQINMAQYSPATNQFGNAALGQGAVGQHQPATNQPFSGTSGIVQTGDPSRGAYSPATNAPFNARQPAGGAVPTGMRGTPYDPNRVRIEGDDVILPDGTRIIGAARRFITQGFGQPSALAGVR